MSRSSPALKDRWTRGEVVFFLGVGVVCLAVLIVIGKMSTTGSEEWDAPLFFQFLLPVAATGAFPGGFLFPGHSWRWEWRHGGCNTYTCCGDTARETSGPLLFFFGFWRFCRLLLWQSLLLLSRDIESGRPMTENLMSSNPRIKTDVENARI